MKPPKDRETVSAIAAAIETNDIESVRALFEAHPEQIECYTPYAGGTWLHFAAGSGSAEVVGYLLSSGIDVNEGDRWDGATALVTSASHGRERNAELLLDHGARMDVSETVRNPLFAVSFSGASIIARMLLDRGIDAAVRYTRAPSKEINALGNAVMWGRRDIARMIAEHLAGGDEARVEALMEEGKTLSRLNTQAVSSE